MLDEGGAVAKVPRAPEELDGLDLGAKRDRERVGHVARDVGEDRAPAVDGIEGVSPERELGAFVGSHGDKGGARP